jgi:hypothetical protein
MAQKMSKKRQRLNYKQPLQHQEIWWYGLNVLDIRQNNSNCGWPFG